MASKLLGSCKAPPTHGFLICCLLLTAPALNTRPCHLRSSSSTGLCKACCCGAPLLSPCSSSYARGEAPEVLPHPLHHHHLLVVPDSQLRLIASGKGNRRPPSVLLGLELPKQGKKKEVSHQPGNVEASKKVSWPVSFQVSAHLMF